jgi:hypothetical protein
MDSELRERRSSVLRDVISVVSEVKELENGFAYRFPGGETRITELANLIDLEHRCCPFLTFRVTVEAGDGPIWLEMTGPTGTKEFLAEVFN